MRPARKNRHNKTKQQRQRQRQQRSGCKPDPSNANSASVQLDSIACNPDPLSFCPASPSFSSTSTPAAGSSSASTSFASGMEWLIDAFATLSFDQIQAAYAESKEDVFRAAEILSSLAQKDVSPVTPSAARKAKTGRVVAVSGTVSSVIGKSYFPAISPTKAGVHEPRGSKERRIVDLRNLEKAEEFLCDMLGYESELGMGVVKDVLGQCGYDAGKALEVLLNLASTSSRSKEMDGCFYSPKKNINDTDSFPEPSKKFARGTTACSLKLTDNTPTLTYHPSGNEDESLLYGGSGYLKDPPGPEVRHPPDKSTKFDYNSQHRILESFFQIPDSTKHEPSSMNWKKTVQKLREGETEFNTASNCQGQSKIAVHSSKGDGYQEFRHVASKHWNMMKDCYAKAAVAYSGGQRAYASYLAEQGKHFENLARKEDQKASQEIFAARNKHIENMITIDLHGQHVKQAIGLLKQHLLLLTCVPSVRYLKVITGCGSGGVGKGKIKSSVLSLATNEGIVWIEENVGTIMLRLDNRKFYRFAESSGDSE